MSSPEATGKATETSIGVPSQTGTVAAPEFGHQRWPAVAPEGWVVHFTLVPKTSVIVALAAAGSASTPRTTTDSSNILHRFSMNSPL